MHYRRSWLTSFLAIVLTALLLSACSNNNTENKLSELEDIKLNQYMTDSGITIPESVLEMGELVFNQNRANLIVHCMVSEKPDSWDSNWDFTYNEQYKITVEWKK